MGLGGGIVSAGQSPNELIWAAAVAATPPDLRPNDVAAWAQPRVTQGMAQEIASLNPSVVTAKLKNESLQVQSSAGMNVVFSAASQTLMLDDIGFKKTENLQPVPKAQAEGPLEVMTAAGIPVATPEDLFPDALEIEEPLIPSLFGAPVDVFRRVAEWTAGMRLRTEQQPASVGPFSSGQEGVPRNPIAHMLGWISWH